MGAKGNGGNGRGGKEGSGDTQKARDAAAVSQEALTKTMRDGLKNNHFGPKGDQIKLRNTDGTPKKKDK